MLSTPTKQRAFSYNCFTKLVAFSCVMISPSPQSRLDFTPLTFTLYIEPLQYRQVASLQRKIKK